MGLLFLTHLQAVFNATEKNIGSLEVGTIQSRNEINFLNCLQSFQSIGLPQGLSSSAIEQLKRLHKKLDLTNSSHSQFNIQLIFSKVFLFGSLFHVLNIP